MNVNHKTIAAPIVALALFSFITIMDALAVGPTPLNSILGGTGISTTSQSNQGKNLYAESVSPEGVITYGFQTNGSLQGGSTTNVLAGNSFIEVAQSGTNATITPASVLSLANSGAAGGITFSKATGTSITAALSSLNISQFANDVGYITSSIGGAISFLINGLPFVTTSTINFAAGTNITIGTSSDGTYTINSTGGGGGLSTTTPWTLGDFTIASTTGAVTTISTTSARTLLGLGTAALQNITAFLQVANNGSDIANTSTFRTNLGLTDTATLASTTWLKVANNGSDINNTSTFRSNLGLTDTAITASSSFLKVANNLSDLNNASTSRGNLGLGNNNLVQFLGLTTGNATATNATTANQAITGLSNTLAYIASDGRVVSTSTPLLSIAGGGTTVTGAALAGRGIQVSGQTFSVSSTVVSSTISRNLYNATTTTSTTNPILYTTMSWDYAQSITKFSCIEVSGTTTLQVYKTSGIGSMTNLSDIITSIACGSALNTTTTFTSSTLQANEQLVMIPTSTVSGTPQITRIQIDMNKL